MINLDLGGNGDTHVITNDVVNEAIETLENPFQKVTKITQQIDLKSNWRILLFHF